MDWISRSKNVACVLSSSSVAVSLAVALNVDVEVSVARVLVAVSSHAAVVGLAGAVEALLRRRERDDTARASSPPFLPLPFSFRDSVAIDAIS
jgi:hypothetical protein